MFKRILVPLDGSTLAESVLQHAQAVSQSGRTQIHLLRAINPAPADPHLQIGDPLDWKLRKVEAGAYLESIAARFDELGFETVANTAEGRPAETIIEYAHAQAIDLILMSSHGRSGLNEWNLNSVVQKVVHRAPTSILIVRAQRAPHAEGVLYRRIFLPLDGSQRAESILPTAVELARAWESELLVAHVVARPEIPRRRPLTQEEAELAERLVECNRLEAGQYLAELKGHFDFPLETHLFISAKVAATLHRFVAELDADLVIATAHGLAGTSDWPYGSVVSSFLVYGTTPLLVYQDMPVGSLPNAPAEETARERGSR